MNDELEKLKHQNERLLKVINQCRRIFEQIYTKGLNAKELHYNDDLRALAIDMMCYSKQALREMK
jgi:hypothetical protein